MAKLAYANDEVPVGAIIVKNEKIIGRGFNEVITQNSVSSHAEINAINQASKFTNNYRLKDAIYTLRLSLVICVQKQL